MPAVTAVEEMNDAKAKREAAKAEAARIATEKAAAESLLAPITKDVRSDGSKFAESSERTDQLHLVFGRSLLRAEDLLVEYPVLDLSIAAYCEREVPTQSGPVFGSSPAYRALQAARVEREIADDVGATKVQALRAMHRVKDVRGAATKTFRAAKKAAGNGPITESLVNDALAKLYPKDEAKTPGPVAKASKAKTERNTPTEPVEVPDHAVSGPRLNGAKTRMTKVLDPKDGATAWMIAAATVQCATDYGIAATAAAIQGLAPAPAKAAKAKTTPKAKTTTRKATTRKAPAKASA